jgi:hypothetical protein
MPELHPVTSTTLLGIDATVGGRAVRGQRRQLVVGDDRQGTRPRRGVQLDLEDVGVLGQHVEWRVARTARHQRMRSG